MRRAICLSLLAVTLAGCGSAAGEESPVAAARTASAPAEPEATTPPALTAPAPTTPPASIEPEATTPPAPTAPAPAEPEATTRPAPAPTEPPSPVAAARRAPTPTARLDAAVARLPARLARTGIAYVAGDHPDAPGHWGVYDRAANVAYLGPPAFADDERLFMIVAHETGHALIDRGLPIPVGDRLLAQVAATAPGLDPDEALADCFAAAWGATSTNYWSCPTDLVALAQDAFAHW